MTTKPDQLELRRQALLLKISAQRQVLALQLQDMKQSANIAELGYRRWHVAHQTYTYYFNIKNGLQNMANLARHCAGDKSIQIQRKKIARQD